MRRIIRPARDATTEQRLAYYADVAAALEEAGVGHEQSFAVVPYEGDAPEHADDNQLGRWGRQSETARKAALANYPRSGKQKHRILLYAVSHAERGVISDEVARDLGLPLYSAKPRMKDLRDGGWLARRRGDDGEFITRRSRHGVGVDVHWPTQKALQEVMENEDALPLNS